MRDRRPRTTPFAPAPRGSLVPVAVGTLRASLGKADADVTLGIELIGLVMPVTQEAR